MAKARWCTQSVMVRRARTGPGSSAQKARSYVRKKGYRAGRAEKTEGFYRFRQAPPTRFRKRSMRTLCVSHRMCFVRGILKEKGACP